MSSGRGSFRQTLSFRSSCMHLRFLPLLDSPFYFSSFHSPGEPRWLHKVGDALQGRGLLCTLVCFLLTTVMTEHAGGGGVKNNIFMPILFHPIQLPPSNHHRHPTHTRRLRSTSATIMVPLLSR